MTTNKLEYDSTLGGPVVLASHVSTYRYAAASVKEIRRLLDEVRNPTSTKLVFQRLPKHMRRRAMSHHPKRLPRRYRAIHSSQMAKAGKPQMTRRPSRKYRRKPSNLLREYIRRQRSQNWLETHIWHAKRFHMISRWGYRLPWASCDKTYRACYRATSEHCLVQDISFYACLQLEGTLVEIGAGFAKLSSSCCGLSVLAKTYVSGRREGSLELFRDNQYPEGALGRVSFMWQPLEQQQTEGEEQRTESKRMLWLWVHPSGYQAVLEEIIKIFHLATTKSVTVQLPEQQEKNEQPTAEDGAAVDNKKQPTSAKTSLPKKQQRRLQFMTKTLAYERIKRYTNSAKTLMLSELKDTLNRFRLTGPMAQSVLANAFKPKPFDLAKEPANWFQAQLSAYKSYQEYHDIQANYWQECAAQLRSPAELMSNIILALNIEDPRIHRPKKRTKAVPPTRTEPNLSTKMLELIVTPPAALAHSCIWQAGVRDRLCEQMLSTQAYGIQREVHAVVPGAPCPFERQLQPVPVLLVQRPGSQHSHYKRLGYACGWDVIAPAGYGMSIWLALIMWGARPGGLREFASVARELGTDEFYPDTVGGQQHLAERQLELRSKYFRLPPNKRCNFRKFSIVSPFRVPFNELVRDWQFTTPLKPSSASSSKQTNRAFYILRDRSLLEQLQMCIAQRRSDFPKALLSSPNCLVQLQLLMKSRGSSGDFALICLPTRTDFKRNLKLLKRENHDPVYTEPLQHDPNEKQRKTLRVEHKKLLKRLRGRRVRQKRKQQQTSTLKVHISPAGTSQLVAEQYKRMCELWLPESHVSQPQGVRKQCTRAVFGYVTNSNFSYIEASVCSVGYVTIEGLRQLLDVCRVAHVKRPMCLMRCTNSRNYRFASFKLNLQV